MSGKPVVMYELPGIPHEYSRYLFYVHTNESLTECVKKIICLSDEKRSKLGTSARNFIQNEKNPKIQTKKIIECMKMEVR